LDSPIELKNYVHKKRIIKNITKYENHKEEFDRLTNYIESEAKVLHTLKWMSKVEGEI
jgi:uncharacterized protein YozE (UPF0346 family)